MLVSSNLEGLQSWRDALKQHGIKDFSMEFSSSEDDNDKAERKLTTRNKIASALTTKFVLKKPTN